MTETDISLPANGRTLGATLTTTGDTPGPAALLISGSGPIDRNSNTKRLSIDVMGRIAADLAAEGVGSLRYDKRGVGESEGDYHATGFHDNIADAEAALSALIARPEVDPGRIVVIGHSEGALIATALARTEPLAGVALLAGTAQPGRQVLEWQAAQVAPTLPKPAKILLKLLRQDIVATQAKRLDRLAASTDYVIRIQLVKVNAKWFREFLAFDPADSLRQAGCPVLAITGSKDIQVDPADVARMSELVPTSFTGHVVDDVSHLLRHEAGPPSVRTYKKQADQPLDPRVVQLLLEWVKTTDRTAVRSDHTQRST
ncbi:MAG: alpha/beta fold hydrolase [Actinomycetota bacterium]